MRQLWVYGISVLMTTLGIGGTLFFFMKTPAVEQSYHVPETIPPVEEASDRVTTPVDEPLQNPVSNTSGTNSQPVQTPAPVRNEKLAEEIAALPNDEKLNLAAQLKQQGDFLKARQILSDMIQSPNPVPYIQEVQKQYWEANIQLIFSNQQVEGWTQETTVKKGDSLEVISKRFKTTVDLIRKSNGLQSDLIHIGQKLRVFTGVISILVDKSLNTLTLQVNGEVVKVYAVGTGKEGSTPVGQFKIVNKIAEPPWHHEGKVYPYGDPENILGTRWMGFDFKGYGIHGTTQPDSVGSQSSAGCVRLRNEEVEELYKIVPVGTIVTVVE